MFQPPSDLTDTELLNLVRSGWLPTVDRVEYLGVGFGAYHWRAGEARLPRWFVTYDRFSGRHTATSLVAAYAGAIELAERGLEFVLAPVRTRSGDVLVPVADGALSCTPWVTGEVVGAGPLNDADGGPEHRGSDETAHVRAAGTDTPIGDRWWLRTLARDWDA